MLLANSQKIRGVLLSLVLMAAFVPSAALAALEVTFAATPLFENANVLPGDAVTRTVTVTNTGSDTQDIIFSLENTFSDGLADVMEMAVVSGSDLYADTTLSGLFSWGEVDLGVLPPQSSKTYEFTAFLDPEVGNAYQLSELGFDLLIGFSGGETVTDSPGSGGGGGAGLVRNEFDLFNEAVEVEDDTIAVVTWNTNRSATSFAVCGAGEAGPFDLDPDDTLFGYEFGSVEDTTMSLSHQTEFADLDPGTYFCRVASREDTDDAFTVSSELQFSITPDGQVAGIADSQPFVQGNFFQPTPSVAGVHTGGKGSHMTYQEYRAELDAMKAAREAQKAGKPTLTTTKTQPIDDEPATIDVVDSSQTDRSYWPMVLFLGVLLLAGGWWSAQFFRNR